MAYRKPIPEGVVRALEWEDRDIKTYTGFFFYIIDFDQDLQTEANTQEREHHDVCTIVKEFFDHNSDFEIHCVKFGPEASEATWNAYWKEEFNDKSSQDLVFFYYHGNSYQELDSGTWHFRFQHDFSNIDVDAFLTRIKKTDFDATVIIESSNIESRTYLDNNYQAMTEIILSNWRETKLQDGRIVNYYGHYGRKLVENLEAYLNDVQAYVPRIPFYHWEFQSIPQLLRADPDLRLNRTRILNHVANRKKMDHAPWRIMTDPVDDASTGRIKFYGKPTYSREVVAAANGGAAPGAAAGADDDDDDDDMDLDVDMDEGIVLQDEEQADVAMTEEEEDEAIDMDEGDNFPVDGSDSEDGSLFVN